MIEEIVPKSAACAESFGGSLGSGLFPEEETLVARATHQRREEFTTGRECARSALAALDVPAAPTVRASSLAASAAASARALCGAVTFQPSKAVRAAANAAPKPSGVSSRRS